VLRNGLVLNAAIRRVKKKTLVQENACRLVMRDRSPAEPGLQYIESFQCSPSAYEFIVKKKLWKKEKP
jgi:hypothetical protein